MANGQMTLAQLRLAAQQRADQVNSNFVGTAEWNSYINQSIFELYDLLVGAYGNDYYSSTPAQFTTDGVNQVFALPDGTTTFINGFTGASFTPPAFYKMLGLDLMLYSGSPVTFKTFKFNERNRFAIPNIQTLSGVTNLKYRLNGNNIMFNNIPQAGQILKIWYVPRMTELVSDSDIADGVNGWLEYVIVDAAIKAMQKEESDVTVLGIQKQALINRIQAMAENRDPGDAPTVSDTRDGYSDHPYGSYDGSGEY